MKKVFIFLLITFHSANANFWRNLDPFGIFNSEHQSQNRQDISASSFNGSYILAIPLVLGGLILASAGLYALDVYATARIDQFLLDYYGPQMYDRFTTEYEPLKAEGPHFTATTANKYYGYRSLYGLKVLGWLEHAHLAYGAAKEVLKDPTCKKRLICELKSTPIEDKSWWTRKLEPVYELIYSDQNEIFQLGRKDICQQYYQGCQAFDDFLESLKNQ